MNDRTSEGTAVAVEEIHLLENSYRVRIRARAAYRSWNVRYENFDAPNGEALFTLDLPSGGHRARKHPKSIEYLEREAQVQTLQFCEELVKQLKGIVSPL